VIERPPDAESAEDSVEQIVGVDCADHFAEFGQCRSHFNGNKFVAASLARQLVGTVKRVGGQPQAFSTSHGARGDRGHRVFTCCI
jgi:hypothetical protein